MDWQDWRAARLAALTAADGWLNLTDRIEIPAGKHRVGRGSSNDLVLSVGPEFLGVIEAGADWARLEVGGQVLDFQPTAGFPQLVLSGLILELHTVDGQPALRVRDTEARPEVRLDYFPHDPAWVIEADWVALPAAERHRIGQKGAGDTEVDVTHVARFELDGRAVSLLATHRKGGQPMFVIRDATSGRETYGAGRFLMGEVRGDRVLLDFNRAHNPPCAFTPFAICPLPPPENRFPERICAGELKLAELKLAGVPLGE